MRGQKRSPEDIERGLEALAESGGNAEAASRATGIPANTLRTWKRARPDEFIELRREKRTVLIEDVWAAAQEALKELRGKFKTMKGQQLAVAFGILTDKALVLGGEPSQITETQTSNARSRLLEAVEEEMEAPEAGTEEEAS